MCIGKGWEKKEGGEKSREGFAIDGKKPGAGVTWGYPWVSLGEFGKKWGTREGSDGGTETKIYKQCRGAGKSQGGKEMKVPGSKSAIRVEACIEEEKNGRNSTRNQPCGPRRQESFRQRVHGGRRTKKGESAGNSRKKLRRKKGAH